MQLIGPAFLLSVFTVQQAGPATDPGVRQSKEGEMVRVRIVALLTLLGMVCAPTLAQRQAGEYRLMLKLPRFDGSKTGKEYSPTFDEVNAALKGLPCLLSGPTLYGDASDRRVVHFTLLPKKDSDLGDGQSPGQARGDKKKPVATVSLALADQGGTVRHHQEGTSEGEGDRLEQVGSVRTRTGRGGWRQIQGDPSGLQEGRRRARRRFG
jgi:hypothetical protein